MQMVKAKGIPFLLVAVVACALGLVGLAGCSGGTQTAATVGTQSDSAKSIVLSNGLGSDITQVSVNPSGVQGAATALEVEGAWADGSAAQVFIPEENQSAPCDIALTTGSGEYVLHEIDLSAFEEAQVLAEGEVAYLSYEVDGQTVTTLDHENELIAQAKAAEEAAKKAAEEQAKKEAEEAAAKKAEEEAAKKAEEEAAQAEAEAAAAAEEEVYYEEPEVTYEEEAPAQSGDSCVEGGVALR